MRVRSLHVLAAAALSACALCAHYPLMALWRSAGAARHPESALSWTNDGDFAVLGAAYPPFLPEEIIYAARAKTAATHGLPYDPFIRENRGLRMATNDFLVYYGLGLAVRILGDVERVWSLFRFLCAGAWFALLFWLALQATGSEELSAAFAAFVTFFSYLLTGMFIHVVPWEELPSLRGLLRVGWLLASYGRTESVLRLPRPGITYAAIFGASLLAMRAFGGALRGPGEREVPARGPAGAAWLAGAGVLAGALAYFHFDVWTTAVAALFVLGAWESLESRRLLHPLWLPAAIAALVSLPWLALNYPPDPDLLVRVATFGRAPNPVSFIYLAAFCVGVRVARDAPLRYLSALMAALFLVLNIQIATGYAIEPFHWYWFGNIYLLLFLAALLPERWKARGRLWLGGAALGLVAVLVQNWVYASRHFAEYARPKVIDSGVAWLRDNAEIDAVVATLDQHVAPLLPAKTRCKVLVAFGNPVFSDIPMLENVERFRHALSFYGRSWEDFLDTAAPFAERSMARDAFWGTDFTNAHARRLLAEPAVARGTPAKTFRVDYLWWGPLEAGLFGPPPASLGGRGPAFRNAQVAIYRVEGA